jgi:hypothetical protein
MMSSNRPDRRATVPLAAGLIALAALAGGCQLPLAIAEKMFPNRTVQPLYELPEDKRVLVFPDDRTPIAYPPIKRQLAERANEVLREKGLVAGVIDYDRLMDLRSAEPRFNELSIGGVGQRLGADLVIYVVIDEFSLKDTPIQTLWRGRFSTRVKVIDVEDGRVWPDSSAGHELRVTEPATENPSETFGAELAERLAVKMAAEVVGAFHEHEVSRHDLPPSTSGFGE